MDTIIRVVYNQGEIIYTIGNKENTISFKKDDGTTNRYFFIRFFTAVFALLRESYSRIGKKKADKKEKKFLLYTDDEAIVVAAVDAIWRRWDEIENELKKAEELRITNEVSV